VSDWHVEIPQNCLLATTDEATPKLVEMSSSHYDEVEYVWNDKFCIERENSGRKKLVTFERKSSGSQPTIPSESSLASNSPKTPQENRSRQSRLASMPLGRWNSAPSRSGAEKLRSSGRVGSRSLLGSFFLRRSTAEERISPMSAPHGMMGLRLRSEVDDRKAQNSAHDKSSSMNLSDFASMVSE